MISSNQKPLVSVIVPCYNYGSFLTECLSSIQAQSFKQWECILVDNASTDNTKEIALQFSNSDDRFKYIYTEVKGVSYARNLGIKSSNGDYILPVDADDKISPYLIEKALAAHQQDKNITLVYSDAELFGNSSGKWVLPEYSLKDLLIENSIFCTAMFKRPNFNTTQGYNENMKEGFEDWDFWIGLLKSGGKVVKIPEVLFYYRIRENSRNSVLDDAKQLRLREIIYNNHKAVYEAHFSIPKLVYENYNLNTQLNSIERSKDYNLGKKIMKPIRFIKSLFVK
jgi:glycosyltransferase involved in cell wall biosynthesis